MDDERLEVMVQTILADLGAEDAVITDDLLGRFSKNVQSRAFPGEAVYMATAYWESQFYAHLDIDRSLYIVLTADGRWTLTNSWGDAGRKAGYKIRRLDMDRVEAALA